VRPLTPFDALPIESIPVLIDDFGRLPISVSTPDV
jgi:hypothetical protein